MDRRRVESAAMGELTIPGTRYLGGFSYLAEKGRLVLNDETVTMDRIPNETLTRNFDAPFELCRTRAIASMEVTSEQVAKSKVGAAMLFGVLGAVTAKGAEDRATIGITLKSGEVGYLTVANESTASLLARLGPWMRQQGIAQGPPEALAATTTAEPKLIADELAKLWELHKAGALTEEEFSAHKARLLS
jgi:hypothetical protein